MATTTSGQRHPQPLQALQYATVVLGSGPIKGLAAQLEGRFIGGGRSPPWPTCFWLTPKQIKRIERYFPLSRGVPRVDDRRVISGILHVIRNGLRWRDAPADYGPYKTIYNRFVRWSRLGVFNRIFAALAGRAGPARHPDNRRHSPEGAPDRGQPASKKGLFPMSRAHQGRPELQAARRLRRPGQALGPAAHRRTGQRLQGCGADDGRSSQSQGDAGRSRLRRRLVQGGLGPPRRRSLHPVQIQPQGARPLRQGALPPADTASRTCSAG